MLWSRLKHTNLCHYDNEKGFHVRCLAHNISLAVKTCMSKAHDKKRKTKLLLNSIRSSVKWRYLFEVFCNAFSLKVEILSLDVEMRGPRRC